MYAERIFKEKGEEKTLRRKRMTGFFLAAALTAIIIGGCGPGEEPEVIGEKREPAVSGEQTLSLKAADSRARGRKKG